MSNHVKKTVWILCMVPTVLQGYSITNTSKDKGPQTKEIAITFALDPEEHLYKDSIHISVNSPAITLSTVHPSTAATTLFDKSFKTEKEVYTDQVTFTLDAHYTNENTLKDTLLFVPFMINSVKEPQQITIPLFKRPEEQSSSTPSMQPALTQKTAPEPSSTSTTQSSEAKSATQPEPSYVQGIIDRAHHIGRSVKGFLSSLFTSTGSPFIRAGAAFLLGLLLSLTPCIYPMIPITIGILQASGSKSTFRNFLLALSYTLGISSVFALFGFLAAMGGPAFGELQGNPWFVIPVALLFFFFGLTMFDVVQFPIPRFLQPKKSTVQGGSLSSAYLFGAVSGTVASPCLSPGLVLILHYVASLAAGSLLGYVEGLGLLFLFGIGSSTPLLIIGTFSGSLKLLPKSGLWMVEIKKIVGVMLISMALYYLSHLERLLPWHIFAWIAAAVYVALGVYYIVKSTASGNNWMNVYRTSMGILFFIGAGYLAVQGQKALYDYWNPPVTHEGEWSHSYKEALEQAQREKKLLFADIGATYCAACKELHQQIFTKPPVLQALKRFVVLMVQSDIHTESYKALRSAYPTSIEGFPTYLVIDPLTGKIIKDWSIEIEELGAEGTSKALNKLVDTYPLS